MNLSERATRLREMMDDPSCDPERLRRTLERFDLVNKLVSRWGPVYRSVLRPALAALNRPARVLDIGCGAGDVLRGLVRLAHRDGFEVKALGVDPDPRALEVATRAQRGSGVSYREAHSRTLVEEGREFDIVLSNHLLHHLDDVSFDGLLLDSEALATRLAVHSDIARSRTAYLAYSAGSLLIAPGSFLRVDGLRSIRRSYTTDELQSRLPRDWRVEKSGTFRLLAVRRNRGSHPG